MASITRHSQVVVAGGRLHIQPPFYFFEFNYTALTFAYFFLFPPFSAVSRYRGIILDKVQYLIVEKYSVSEYKIGIL